ncbi:hypothetical protein [Nonomuraea soli]|uniref:WD40 repeat domain-containing protein n=1 Tax=Nonomuraea soli TaxID=1032476 RepID=A0A7W0HMF7_9ACTN|nr:hypothetical protein [Nonomuraea soli]MBA2888700.1 hypothetical protein [Nonomuraea soli]
MTHLFRDRLEDLAGQAPSGPGDLAERAVRGARRRRAGTLLSALAAVIALSLGAAAVTADRGGDDGVTTGTVSETLPPSGVGPLSHAYYDFCGEKWDMGGNTASFTGRACTQWKVVTRSGQTYRMPEALSVYTEQSAENYMNTGAPVAITPDGLRIAYYDEAAQRFAVRELDSGRIVHGPQTVTRAELVSRGTLLMLSPDGRRMATHDTITDLETGETTAVPKGWTTTKLPNGDLPAVVTSERGPIGLLADGQVRELYRPKHWFQVAGLTPDGTGLIAITGTVPTDQHMTEEGQIPYDTVVTIDTRTGKERSRAAFNGAPPDISPMRTGVLDERRILVADARVGGRERTDPPTLGDRIYTIDRETGEVRAAEVLTYRGWAGDLVAAGL